MEIANFTHNLNTIGTIPSVVYLKRLKTFLLFNFFLNSRESNNSIAIINSLGSYLNEYEFHDEYSNRLTQYLLNDNFLTQTNATYEKSFKRMLTDHVISSIVFEEYGSIYGFLADVYKRGGENQRIDTFLNKTRLFLSSIRKEFHTSTAILSVDLVERILNGMIIPLFPGSRGTFINSLDLIYAQAGSILYNSAFVKYNYSFDLTIEENTPKYSSKQYNFDDCLEIGLSIQQLVIFKQLPKTALQTFALPALLNYIQMEKKILENEKIATVIADQKHWNRAFEHLFLKINKAMDFVKLLEFSDPKYNYHLALYHYENKTQFTRKLLLEECDIVNKNQLEEETWRYLNTSNYTCSKNKTLLPLDVNLKTRDKEFLRKYFLLRKAMSEEVAKNRSVTITGGRFTINGETFTVCNAFKFGNRRRVFRKSKKSKVEEKRMVSKLGKLKIDVEKLLANNSTVKMDANEARLLRRLTKNVENRNKESVKKNSKSKSKENHCFLMLYACMTGIMEGNRISSPNNCPIPGALRFQDVTTWDVISAQLMTFDTRFELFKFGISMRTVALMNSMETALEERSNRTMNGQHLTNNMISDIESSKFPAIDVGYEIGGILGSDGLSAIENLLRTIEREFFVSYLPATRNFSMNIKNLA